MTFLIVTNYQLFLSCWYCSHAPNIKLKMTFEIRNISFNITLKCDNNFLLNWNLSDHFLSHCLPCFCMVISRIDCQSSVFISQSQTSQHQQINKHYTSILNLYSITLLIMLLYSNTLLRCESFYSSIYTSFFLFLYKSHYDFRGVNGFVATKLKPH